MTFHLDFMELYTKPNKIIYTLSIRGRNMYIMTIIYKPFYDLQTEVINNNIVVNQEKYCLCHYPSVSFILCAKVYNLYSFL